MPPGGNPPSDRKKPLPPPPFGGPRPPPSPTSNPPPTPPPSAAPAPQPPPAAPPQPAAAAPSRPNRASNPPPMVEPPTQPRPSRSTNPPPAMLGSEPAKLPPTPAPPAPAPGPASGSPLFGGAPPVAAPLPAAAPPPASAPPPPAAPAAAPSSHGPPSGSRLPLPAPGGVASPPPGAQQPFDIPPLPEMSLAPDRPFLEFAKISLKRAFRVRIDPNELTAHERATLDKAGIVQPALRAFLAWRRSVLFGFASFLGVLVVLRAIEVFDKTYTTEFVREAAGGTLQGLNIVILLVEAAFCGVCWWQWTKWTDWKKQQKLLTLGWLAYFLVPFVIFLYPLRTTLGEGNDSSKAIGEGMVFALLTLMMLAPRALAFLPGIARAATVTKFQFPSSPVPGWALLVVTPLYALFLLLILVVPYQVTGSGYFILALGGFLGAAYFVTKAALELRGPVDRDQIGRAFAKMRTGYYIAIGIGVLFILVGLAELVDQLNMKGLTVVNLVGVAVANIWILTLVATDHLIGNLEAGRHVEGFTSPASGPTPPSPPS